MKKTKHRKVRKHSAAAHTSLTPQQRWAKAHPDKVRKYHEKWAKSHKTKVKEYHKKWYNKHHR